MSYHLDYLSVLKAIVLPFDPVFSLLVVVPLLAVAAWLAWRIKRGDQPKVALTLSLILVIVIPVGATLGISVSQVGTGWELADGKLDIKAPPVDVSLAVDKMQVAFVESDGPWGGWFRSNGYGTTGLTTGWCQLKNGKTAAVFRHLQSAKMVVIFVNKEYYVIAHPGVETLYRALIAEGASEADLEE